MKNNEQVNSAMESIKAITLGIFLRVAGTMFQSLLSLTACVAYVISTYYDESEM